MKTAALLNAPLSHVIARLGHGDQLVIADAGLPIPAGPQRIDLAVTRGVPGFEQVLRAVLTEMKVERIIVAEELQAQGSGLWERLPGLLPGVPVETVAHAEFKRLTATAQAVARTGECTPYANVILVAGVAF